MQIRKAGNKGKEYPYKTNKLFFLGLAFGLVVMGFVIIITNIVTSESGAPPPGPGSSDGGGPYYSTGDWVIQNEDDITRINQTIVLSGNLIIENGGSLTFKNVTLIMNCSDDGEFWIVVKDGGKFFILDYDNNPKTKEDRGNITANNTEYEFKFLVDSGAEFEMRNSELCECGYRNGEDGRAGLTIKSDNAIIDNSKIYNNYYGIYLYYSNNNQITNNNVSKNFYGIYLVDSSNNQITKNTFYSHYVDGIYFWDSSNNQITNNSVFFNNGNGFSIFYSSNNNQITNNTIYSNNNYGISLSSSNITMKDNIINNNKYNFDVGGTDVFQYYHDIDTSNTINGKPIFYIINSSDIKIDDTINLGYLGLISCSNVTIKNLSLSNNEQGILFVSTTDSLIENCEISDNNCGIFISSSSNNQITNNSVSNNSNGIYFDFSNNNQITNNNVSNNDYGIFFYFSNNNQITNNSVHSNSVHGIHLYFSSNNNRIINNNVTNSKNGVYL